MKAKAILLGAILAAVTTATQAQIPVYSVNVVGYTKLSLPAGFSLIANQLNAATNTLNSLLGTATNLAPGTTIYKFNTNSGGFDSHTYTGSAWIPDATLAPGEGAFISLAAPSTVLFSGDVTLGTNSNLSIGKGYSIISSKVPQATNLSGVLLSPPTPGDTVYRYNSSINQYSSSTWTGSSWVPDSTLNIGESFWISTAQSFNWNRNFAINP